MSPLQHSTNIAARMGRWSARHRKTAIFGWLAFVVASFAIGTAVGMQTIDQNDTNVGEARVADHIIRDGGFPVDEQSEYVLVQSGSTTVDDPAFRAVVNQAIGALERFPQVTKLRSPLAPGNGGQVSKDGLFSYEEVECLGACEYAPVCRLDHRYEVDLTRAKIDSLVNDRRLVRSHIRKVTVAPPDAPLPEPPKKRAPRTKKSG